MMGLSEGDGRLGLTVSDGVWRKRYVYVESNAVQVFDTLTRRAGRAFLRTGVDAWKVGSSNDRVT